MKRMSRSSLLVQHRNLLRTLTGIPGPLQNWILLSSPQLSLHSLQGLWRSWNHSVQWAHPLSQPADCAITLKKTTSSIPFSYHREECILQTLETNRELRLEKTQVDEYIHTYIVRVLFRYMLCTCAGLVPRPHPHRCQFQYGTGKAKSCNLGKLCKDSRYGR